MLLLRMAWRNIWRNKRRTLITIFSIVLAVMLSAVMQSMQFGSYSQMIQNTAGMFTGYIQIHQDGYWDEPSLNKSFVARDSLMHQAEQVDHIRQVVPRIESYVLAAGKKLSRASLVLGIDPEAENYLSNPQKNVEEGSYFESTGDQSVLISRGLADYLKLGVGDSLVLLGQGFRGMSAAGVYPIKGIVKYGMPDMNRAMVMMPLQTAQEFFALYDRLTAAAIVLDQPQNMPGAEHQLEQIFSDQFEVMNWRELMPEIVQAIEADKGGGYVMLLILYLVVGFGIFGTVLMMTAEREYEFGVMLAIGTSRLRLAIILLFELIFIALIGAAVGSALSLPFMYYFNINPIELTGDAAAAMLEYGMEPVVPFSTDPSILLNQAVIVLIITTLSCLYPLIKSARLEAVTAMRD